MNKLNYIYRKDGGWYCAQTDGIDTNELTVFSNLPEAASFMTLLIGGEHMIEMNIKEKSNLFDKMKDRGLWPPFKIEDRVFLSHDGKFHLLRDQELLEIITRNIKYDNICD